MITGHVLALGDSHFDHESRWDECLRVHDAIAEDVERDPPDVVIHTGDVFERETTPEERRAVADWLRRVAECAPVVLVRGNHDPLGDLALFTKLRTKHPIHVFERPGVVKIGDLGIACLPWPERAELLCALGARAGSEEQKRAGTEALRAILLDLRRELADLGADATVLAAHAMVRAATTSAGQPLVGLHFELGAEDLAFVESDLVLLGHVHKAQQWAAGGIDVVYTGSPRRTEYGETEEKGYLRAFLRAEGPTTWRRVPTPCAQMVLVEADWEPTYKTFEVGTKMPAVDDATGAEIRFRYSVDAADKAAAKAAAAELKASWLAQGAADVQIEPVLRTNVRARAPEIAAAKTLEDKLDLYWLARGIQIAADRRARLLGARLAELREAVGAKASNAGAVRYETLRARGFGPFTGEVALDFRTMPRFVAVSGDNGSGKSVLLGLLAAAATRECPGRGTLTRLAEVAGSRDSVLEVGLVNGQPMTIEHTVDGFSGEGDSLVKGADGRPLTPAGRRNFDAFAGAHLPDPRLQYATTFAVQARSRILGVGAAKLKDVVLEALGHPYLQAMAKAAGARARAAEVEAKTARLRLEDARARAYPGGVESAEAALQAATAEVEGAKKEAEAATWALETVRALALRAEAANNEVEGKLRARRELEGRRDGAGIQRADLAARVRSCRDVLNEADMIRAAETRIAAIALEEKRLADLAADALAKRSAALSDLARARGDRESASVRAAAARGEITQATTRLSIRAEVEATVAALPGLREGVEAEERGFVGLLSALERAHEEAKKGLGDRATCLRGGLGQVAGGAPDPKEVALFTLKADDAIHDQIDRAPLVVKSAQKRVAEADAALKRSRAALAAAERIAARAGEVAAASGALEEATARRTAADADREAASVRVHAAQTAQLEAENAVADLEPVQATLREERLRLVPVAERVTHLATAGARLAELEPQLASTESEIAELDALLAAPAPARVPAPDVMPAEAARSRAQHRLDKATRAEAIAQGAVEGARAVATKVADLEAQVSAHTEAGGDWARLAEDLGRDGLQALEIDAALPEWTTRTNELLHTCYGPRYTVRIEASGLSGKGELVEGLEITVLDEGTRAIEKLGEELSKGEGTIVDEALSLGLLCLACARSGAERPDLIRDESASALHPGHARAYMAMLRRAADEVGASHVFYVSHSPELVAMADMRIELEGGRVEVRA